MTSVNTKDIFMETFMEECAMGQSWLRPRPPEGMPCADLRFFMRGALLDETGGRASASRAALTPLLGDSSAFPLIAPKQVHGTTILDAVKENTLPSLVEGDGILLDTEGLEASLRFGDCAPVVVCSSRKPHWVLMMHSGYKGTVQNIVKTGVEKVRIRYGASAVAASWAWVGPCIGGKNYPRDREEWTLRGLDVFRKENVVSEGTKVFFDLAGELRLQLGEAGVPKERIFLSGIDAFACRDRCYSYRGGDREDRMFLWARLLPQKMFSA